MGERYSSWQLEKQKPNHFLGPNGKTLDPGNKEIAFNTRRTLYSPSVSTEMIWLLCGSMGNSYQASI